MAKIYGGRWEISRSVAEGGQAQVFLARDIQGEFGDELIVKRIRNPKRHDRFKGEVEAVKRLNHPSVIRLIDHSALNEGAEQPEKQFLVMPLAANGDLSKRVDLYKDNVDSVVQVAKQLAGALKAAHDAGIVHRDVKPQNILFPSVGHEVWLSDFGICLIRDQDRSTATSEVVGPMQFMAPELEGGGRLEVTGAADIYSLGKVIYFMLSGGTVLPRERLHDAEYSVVFERGGERQRLFQVILAKMICPLGNRLQTMSDVILEIDRIETWTRDARLLPINPTALAGFEAMQRRAIDNQRIAQENAAARDRRGAVLSITRTSALSWLKAELEKTAILVGDGAGLSSGVRDVKGENAAPTVNQYLPGEAVELWVRSTHDRFQREHLLRFSFCLKHHYRVVVNVGTHLSQPADISEPEHTDVGVLPAYGQVYVAPARQQPVWQLLTMQNGLYQPVSPNPQMVNRNVQRSLVTPHTIQLQMVTFSTENWPGAAERFPDAFKMAVDAFVTALSNQI